MTEKQKRASSMMEGTESLSMLWMRRQICSWLRESRSSFLSPKKKPFSS